MLVRLHAVSVADLNVLITDAWRCRAPADLTRPKGPVNSESAGAAGEVIAAKAT